MANKTILVMYRLTTDDYTVMQATDDGERPPFEITSYGVVRTSDSITGKRRGDTTITPWHRVIQFETWRVSNRRGLRAAARGDGGPANDD